jgi:predicted outer membrane repeat protein
VLIEDCYFADNDNIDYGAGIYASDVDDFQIKNTTFENLHAGDRGGAIWIEGMDNKVYIYNCKFNNNSAGNYGGAIYSQAELYVYDSEFNGNQADWDGGAIYLDAETGDQGSICSYFYRTIFDKNHAGWDGGAIFCNTKGNVMSSTSGSAKAYGCTFTGNSAEDEGGAVYVNSEASFDFASDEETGKPGSMTGNEAREAGGAIFQDNFSDVEARIRMSGEVYVKDNVSSLGKDDIYLVSGYELYIKDITSPEGSIGIRLDSDDGGRAATFLDGNTILSCEAFFADNEGFEIVIGEKITYSITGNTSEPCVDMVKSASAAGSIFGEGSLSMIIALLALIASGVSIFLIVDMKKKLVPAAANNVAETKDEE